MRRTGMSQDQLTIVKHQIVYRSWLKSPCIALNQSQHHDPLFAKLDIPFCLSLDELYTQSRSEKSLPLPLPYAPICFMCL